MKRRIAAGCAALMCMVMVLSLLGGLGPVQAEVPEESIQTAGDTDNESSVPESQKETAGTEETAVFKGESSENPQEGSSGESHETDSARCV